MKKNINKNNKNNIQLKYNGGFMGLFSKKEKTKEEKLVDELVGSGFIIASSLNELLYSSGNRLKLQNTVKDTWKNGASCEEIKKTYDKKLAELQNLSEEKEERNKREEEKRLKKEKKIKKEKEDKLKEEHKKREEVEKRLKKEENEKLREEEKIKREKEKKKREEEKRLKREEKEKRKLLFFNEMTDEELKKEISNDQKNMALQEAGSAWSKIGSLLSFNSYQQLMAQTQKAMIDQNKSLIRQMELQQRTIDELKKTNENILETLKKIEEKERN